MQPTDAHGPCVQTGFAVSDVVPPTADRRASSESNRTVSLFNVSFPRMATSLSYADCTQPSEPPNPSRRRMHDTFTASRMSRRNCSVSDRGRVESAGCKPLVVTTCGTCRWMPDYQPAIYNHRSTRRRCALRMLDTRALEAIGGSSISHETILTIHMVEPNQVRLDSPSSRALTSRLHASRGDHRDRPGDRATHGRSAGRRGLSRSTISAHPWKRWPR